MSECIRVLFGSFWGCSIGFQLRSCHVLVDVGEIRWFQSIFG